MDELIPITDFDKRFFPDISEDERINFILHSNEFERIQMKFEEIQAQFLIPQRAKPAVSGQKRCLDFMLSLAPNPDLIPNPHKITPVTFDKLFNWFPFFHKNLMYDFAKQGETLLNLIDYPQMNELATYRQDPKILGSRTMPPPDQIKPLLTKAFIDYATIYDKYKDNFCNPRMLETSDWKALENAAHQLCLSICCIKPFKDGSNRIARITENLVRLNTGLKFKVFTDKDKFLKEVWELQDSHYKFVNS